jgi:hypothetical protein
MLFKENSAKKSPGKPVEIYLPREVMSDKEHGVLVQ